MSALTSLDREHDGAPPSLDPLFRLLKSDLDRVNGLIVRRMQSSVALVPQVAGHIVSAGGKRHGEKPRRDNNRCARRQCLFSRRLDGG